MGRRARIMGQRAVHRVADELVGEREVTAPLRTLAYEGSIDQLVESVENLGEGRTGNHSQKVRIERSAAHSGSFQQRTRAVGEPRDANRHHLGNTGRHAFHVHAVLRVAEQLGQEERVPAAGGEQLAFEILIATAARGDDQRLDVGRVERTQGEMNGAGGIVRPQEGMQSMCSRDVLFAERNDDQGRLLAQGTHDECDQVHRGAARPVHVLENDENRALLGQARQGARNGVEQSRAFAFRSERG